MSKKLELTFEEFKKSVEEAGVEMTEEEAEFDFRVGQAFSEVTEEVYNAMTSYPAFNSAHEGFSVLKEEVDELWDEVKVKQGRRDIAKMRKEACQVAAMALRFMADICHDEAGQN